jgi:hypothetical protein
MGDGKCSQNLIGKPERKRSLERLGADMILLKLNLGKCI